MDKIKPAPIPHLVFGIDRSGSMITGGAHSFYERAPGGTKVTTLGGGSYYKNPGCRALCVEDAYKYIIEDQLKLAMPALVSVYAHDDNLHPLIVRKPLTDAATITIDPQGDNAMYQCFMDLINRHKNDESVMFVFMADGEDRFESEWIKQMQDAVKKYTAKGWFFAYVGVGGIVKGQLGSASTFGIPEKTPSTPRMARPL